MIIRGRVANRERISKGIGRIELYKIIHCDPRTGARALNGGRVHLFVARRLAKALGVSIDELVDVEGSLEPRACAVG